MNNDIQLIAMVKGFMLKNVTGVISNNVG